MPRSTPPAGIKAILPSTVGAAHSTVDITPVVTPCPSPVHCPGDSQPNCRGYEVDPRRIRTPLRHNLAFASQLKASLEPPLVAGTTHTVSSSPWPCLSLVAAFLLTRLTGHQFNPFMSGFYSQAVYQFTMSESQIPPQCSRYFSTSRPYCGAPDTSSLLAAAFSCRSSRRLSFSPCTNCYAAH